MDKFDCYGDYYDAETCIEKMGRWTKIALVLESVLSVLAAVVMFVVMILIYETISIEMFLLVGSLALVAGVLAIEQVEHTIRMFQRLD